MNGEYIKKMEDERYYALAFPEIKKVISKDLDFMMIADMVKSRIEVFPDICEMVDFFEAVPEFDKEMYVHKKMKTDKESSLTVLKELLPVLEALDDYSNSAIYERLVAFATEEGYKNGYVMWPLRVAVSGKQSTPGGATEICAVIGKEETLKRVKDAIKGLEEVL
jgi:glutamyl-tRNA synthetase